MVLIIVYKTTDVLNKISIAIAAKPKFVLNLKSKADADVKSKYGRGKWVDIRSY